MALYTVCSYGVFVSVYVCNNIYIYIRAKYRRERKYLHLVTVLGFHLMERAGKGVPQGHNLLFLVLQRLFGNGNDAL